MGDVKLDGWKNLASLQIGGVFLRFERNGGKTVNFFDMVDGGAGIFP